MKDTKKQAIELARKLRAKGETVKVYEVVNIYTAPGRGLTSSATYEVR